MPRIVERSATLPLRDDGTLRLVAVSDTHSQPHPAMADRLASLRPDAILHGGDIGDLSVLEFLARFAPVFAVRGNIDTRAPDVPDRITLDLTGAKQSLRLLLLHMAVVGPTLRADVARAAGARKASLVVCGHSHVPFIGRHGDITVFNPGSIGPRRFTLPIVFGTIDVSPDGVRLAHVECATGKAWTPP